MNTSDNTSNCIQNTSLPNQLHHNLTHINAYGEIPLAGSPVACLRNGATAIPQQYFMFHRTKTIVENIIADISFDTNFPLFVSDENGHLFIQVGIIGQENYPPNQKKRSAKIVYGRKWFIEPSQPTSEIIQTAFLALIKAREHELREFFTLYYPKSFAPHTHHSDAKKATTHIRSTPFNSHMDFPLMAKHAELFEQQETDNTNAKHTSFEARLHHLLQHIRLANVSFTLEAMHPLCDAQAVISLNITSDPISPLAHFFPELSNTTLTFITKQNEQSFLYNLMQSLLLKSQQHVEEHFKFKGFARFSRTLNIHAISQFSLDTRLIHTENTPKQHLFKQLFRDMTEQVDSARVPQYAHSAQLKHKENISLHTQRPLEGYLPK